MAPRLARPNPTPIGKPSTRPIFCLCFLVALGADPLRAAELGQGAQLAATCAACHPAGKPGAGIPTIAGRDELAIVEAMRRFKSPASPSHVMRAVALSLSDEELAAVARHLAGPAGGGGP